MSKVFLDTAFAIAISVETDTFHEKAIQLAASIKAEQTRMITTQGILLEIGNAMSKSRYRTGAVALLRSLEEDDNVEIVPLTEELYARAFRLYRERPDKEWGLVDCLSFVVMQDQNITDALTTDEHFAQAGFRVLMREP